MNIYTYTVGEKRAGTTFSRSYNTLGGHPHLDCDYWEEVSPPDENLGEDNVVAFCRRDDETKYLTEFNEMLLKRIHETWDKDWRSDYEECHDTFGEIDGIGHYDCASLDHHGLFWTLEEYLEKHYTENEDFFRVAGGHDSETMYLRLVEDNQGEPTELAKWYYTSMYYKILRYLRGNEQLFNRRAFASFVSEAMPAYGVAGYGIGETKPRDEFLDDETKNIYRLALQQQAEFSEEDMYDLLESSEYERIEYWKDNHSSDELVEMLDWSLDSAIGVFIDNIKEHDIRFQLAQVIEKMEGFHRHEETKEFHLGLSTDYHGTNFEELVVLVAAGLTGNLDEDFLQEEHDDPDDIPEYLTRQIARACIPLKGMEYSYDMFVGLYSQLGVNLYECWLEKIQPDFLAYNVYTRGERWINNLTYHWLYDKPETMKRDFYSNRRPPQAPWVRSQSPSYDLSKEYRLVMLRTTLERVQSLVKE